MCGIAGVIGDFNPNNIDYNKIKDSMFNRGPNFLIIKYLETKNSLVSYFIQDFQ